MTASWEVNKKSIWNYITASTGLGKASYHAPLPTTNWKVKGGFFLQEFHVGVKHGEGNKELRINHGLVYQYKISASETGLADQRACKTGSSKAKIAFE